MRQNIEPYPQLRLRKPNKINIRVVHIVEKALAPIDSPQRSQTHLNRQKKTSIPIPAKNNPNIQPLQANPYLQADLP